MWSTQHCLLESWLVPPPWILRHEIFATPPGVSGIASWGAGLCLQENQVPPSGISSPKRCPQSSELPPGGRLEHRALLAGVQNTSVMSLEMWSLCLADWEGSTPPPPPHHKPLLSQTRTFFFLPSELLSNIFAKTALLSNGHNLFIEHLLCNGHNCTLIPTVCWARWLSGHPLCARHGGNLDPYCVLVMVETLTLTLC